VSLFLGRSMPIANPDNWMATTDRLRLRLLRADDAVPLGSVIEPGLVEAAVAQSRNRALTPWAIVLRDGGGVAGFCGWAARNGLNFYSSVRPPNPASVRVLEKIGMRLVDSYFDEDGQRDILRR
jgi:hypothetical protein